MWNEFTISQCLGPAGMTYAFLYGLEKALGAGVRARHTPGHRVDAATAHTVRHAPGGIQVSMQSQKPAVIELLSMSGRLVRRHRLPAGGTHLVATGSLAPGMHLLRVVSGRQESVRSLVHAR